MPELPEVETMVRGIRPHVVGRTIRHVIDCPNRCQPISLIPSLNLLRQRLVGREFVEVRRLGKRVVLDVSGGASLVVEPRMTGLMLLADPPDADHLRLKWEFRGRGKFNSLWFWDRRGLGTVTLFEPNTIQVRYGPQSLGPDALEMTVTRWTELCFKTRREIKVVLLDQKVVAGIGNLYASEILHTAAINPTAPANSLNRKSLERLADAVRTVLSTAIEYEGSTLADGTYRNALNQNGRYQNKHRAYMREGQKCLACQKMQIVRIIQSQRSTFFCPRCQQHPKNTKSTKGLE